MLHTKKQKNTSRNRSYAGSNSCTNTRILNDILKDRYNFSGFVISDLGAVDNVHEKALVAGMDVYLGSGASGADVEGWLNDGTLTEARLDDAVSRTMLPRFLEGEFDPTEMVPYWDLAEYGCDQIGSAKHQQIGYEAAVQSLVLLKNAATAGTRTRAEAETAEAKSKKAPTTATNSNRNRNSDGSGGSADTVRTTNADTAAALPLAKDAKVAVIGPFGTHARWMFARYSHVPQRSNPLLVSVVDALSGVLVPGGGSVTSAAGCDDVATTTACTSINATAIAEAEKDADVLIYCVGSGEPLESETQGEDAKVTLALPGQQEAMVMAGIATGKKVVVVLFTASPKSGPWVEGKEIRAINSALQMPFSAFVVCTKRQPL